MVGSKTKPITRPMDPMYLTIGTLRPWFWKYQIEYTMREFFRRIRWLIGSKLTHNGLKLGFDYSPCLWYNINWKCCWWGRFHLFVKSKWAGVFDDLWYRDFIRNKLVCTQRRITSCRDLVFSMAYIPIIIAEHTPKNVRSSRLCYFVIAAYVSSRNRVVRLM